MFKNYFITALRNFRRFKVFSAINILGLSIGISSALVIYLIVHFEFSFEKSWKNGNRVYRVVSNMHFPDQDFKNSGVPGPLPAAARNEIPGIEKSAYFWIGNAMNVSVPLKNEKENVFRKQEKIIFADASYFRFVDYDWLAGSPDKALEEPGTVVLTESRARTYFPYADIRNAVGQTIVYDDSIKATVTGVVKDKKEITDFTFAEMVSFSTYKSILEENNGFSEWGSISSNSQFLVQLKEGTDTARFNKELAAVRSKHEKNAYLQTDHFLQPLNDIHFNADFDAFEQRQAHKPTLYGLLAIAAFLLLLGCINFINLTTAHASQRAKEIGVRKTMGSSRRQLVLQFLVETLLLTVLATVVSLALTPWIFKLFSGYIPSELKFDLLHQPHIYGFLAILVLVVSLLSGFYPALILSGFKPVLVLKNLAYAGTAQSRRTWIRKTLTVAQFMIAQFFIIATLVVGQQIRFSLNKDMGFKKDAILNFGAPYNFQNPDNKQFLLQQKLKAIPGIRQLSLAGDPPASIGISMTTMKFNDGKKDVETSVEIREADTAFFNLYKMKLVAGRNLEQSDTSREYVINETYARFLGFTDPAKIVGQYINRGNARIPVVGVIADFNTKSLHTAIPVLAFTCQANRHNNFHIALPAKAGNTDAWRETIAKIETAWKEVYPEDEFKYSFLDESIAKFYEKEQKTARLLNWCAGLAILISCLGLLGLVIYTTTQRTKEIGVRKVLGASVTQIVTLLSKDFMQLVLVGFAIAAPLGWWAMTSWLQDFAYRTQISWWIFALSGLLMTVIALSILSIHTIRAAMSNPVKSLRTE
ncbi:MAG TPA: ABC transporter permease [Ferruginibacter sp.]|nr:ABC transporter permease [Ferruginibacter sp.]HNO99917.1 ABC transporter permease [Ferruginibacter sp.]